MRALQNFAACTRSLLLLAIFAGGMVCSMPGQSAEAQTSHIQESPEWQHGHFQNPRRTWANIPKGLFQEIFGAKVPATTPHQPVAVLPSHGEAFAAPPSSGLRITWFGHSSALIEVDGSRLLIDPFWGKRASPLPWLGPKRWYAPPIPLEELPAINAVLISHDHYDHLDFSTVRRMRTWQTVFIVPLGIGARLRKWGIPQNRIVELDWWQATQLGKLKLVATPARHQSGRSLFPARKTLWAGWAILGDRHRVWYSGDTGYFSDLSKIGERLGPFDVTLIEVGQYGKYWPDFHLGPEQAVETNRDVGGRVMIPVHWGLIRLSHHGWTEPVERVLAAAPCRQVEVLVPRPGESIEPTQHAVIPVWWPKLPWKSASVDPIVATENGNPSHRVSMPPCRQ